MVTAAHFNLLVQGITEYAILMLDTEGHILFANEGIKQFTTHEPAAITGRYYSVFHAPFDSDEAYFREALLKARQEGSYLIEGWGNNGREQAFWTQTSIRPMYDGERHLLGFSHITRNTDEQRLSAHALMESEERYRMLVYSVKDYGIFMMDTGGRIISWNEGARRINGYSAEDILGKHFSIFYPREDIIAGKPAYELEVASETGKYEEEGWRLKKDGSRFWASVVITAVYNADNQLVGFSKVTRDLTERMRAEQALRESEESSRLLVGQLNEANASLEAINKELEQFTSIVSHDLQEPLRTMHSFLELIQKRVGNGLPREVETYINKAISAGQRMKELISGLLQYAQLDKQLELQQVETDSLLEEVMQNLKNSIEAVDARISITHNVPIIYGSRMQLAQLFQNLLANALKFRGSAAPEIEVRGKKEGNEVLFSVKDNGIGIEAEDHERIFEIFRRLHTERRFAGTGIGLAVCKKIVDRHNGRIWLESTPGQGTTFYFTIKQKQG